MEFPALVFYCYGSQYKNMILDQLNTKNESLNGEVDILIEKFNILIKQNRKFIDFIGKNRKDSDT